MCRAARGANEGLVVQQRLRSARAKTTAAETTGRGKSFAGTCSLASRVRARKAPLAAREAASGRDHAVESTTRDVTQLHRPRGKLNRGKREARCVGVDRTTRRVQMGSSVAKLKTTAGKKGSTV